VTRRVVTPLILLIATLASTLASANGYKRGAAGKYQRPAMALRKLMPDVAWARTISTKDGVHTVAWRLKSNEMGTAEITLAGAKGASIVFDGKTQLGSMIGFTPSGKSGITRIDGSTRHVIQELTGKMRAWFYAPRKFIADRAYFLGEGRSLSGQPGSSDGDWQQAMKELGGDQHMKRYVPGSN
jgi:hypothetical protein